MAAGTPQCELAVTNVGISAVQNANAFTGDAATASFTYTGALAFDKTAPQNSSNSGDLNSAFFASAGNPASTNYGITGYNAGSSIFGLNHNFGTGDDNYANLTGFLAAAVAN